jgi:hypothetical protein
MSKYQVGKIFFTLDDVCRKELNVDKEEQLVAVAIYTGNKCTHYLINQPLLEYIFNLTNYRVLQIPEYITVGLLGTILDVYSYLSNKQNTLFRFSKLENIDENSMKKLLEYEESSLVSCTK